MDDFKKLSNTHLGPGGMKCPCCGPKPGKDRKTLRRSTRRRLKQLAWDEMTDEQRINKMVRDIEITEDLINKGVR